MNRALTVLLTLLILSFTLLGDDDPAKVLIVYNTAFPDNNGDGIGDSEEAALYYAAKRGVPSSNLLAVSTSSSTYYYEESGRVDMLDNLVTPLLAKLDSLGESNIFYILLSYGIPEKYVCKGIEHRNRGVDNALCIPHSLGTMDSTSWPYYWHTNSAYFESSPTVYTDWGHFTGTEMYMGSRLFLVTRLDGISMERCKELVDRALYAEMYLYPDDGYYGGTVYVDYRWGPHDDLSGYPFGYSSYNKADSSMAKAREFVIASGWPLREEPYDKEIGETGAKFMDGTDAIWAASAVGYGGWYNYNKYQDAWEWKVGAFANDLNSNSGANLRNSDTRPFLANAFRLGLTCGVGCIAEPYLTGHARPEIFVYYMLNGFNFAEASYLSQPCFKWMGIHVGDPIYNPHRTKTPVHDDVPPPEPMVAMNWENDSLYLSVAIETWGREPDLVKTRVCYGPHNGELEDTIDYGRVYCMWEKIAIGGLIYGDTIDISVDVIDPMLNRTVLPQYSWIVGETGTLDVRELVELPDNLDINVFPNPFNSAVVISVETLHATSLHIEIFDINGRLIKRLGITNSEFIWRPEENIPSGIYHIRVRADNRELGKKVVYLK